MDDAEESRRFGVGSSSVFFSFLWYCCDSPLVVIVSSAKRIYVRSGWAVVQEVVFVVVVFLRFVL